MAAHNAVGPGLLVIAILGTVACGSSSGSQRAVPRSGAAQATRARPFGSSEFPGVPPSGGGAFAAQSSPTPLATCAPADLLRVVDKTRALPGDYVPPDLVTLDPIDSSPRPAITLRLRREAADAQHRMLGEARASSLFIVALSGFRDYRYQEQVYQEEVLLYGQQQADRESAIAGHSEHELGTAVDLTTRQFGYDTDDGFGTSAEGQWMQQHAAQFGFVLSYPRDKEAVTGYMYEPWHYRYVGVNTAQAMQKSGMTLEEWLLAHPGNCQG